MLSGSALKSAVAVPAGNGVPLRRYVSPLACFNPSDMKHQSIVSPWLMMIATPSLVRKL